MLLVSVYNIYSNAFFSCFHTEFQGTTNFFIIDNGIEGLFFIDMLCCFFQEYLDEETFTEVSEVK